MEKVTPIVVTAFFDIGRSDWDGTFNGHKLPTYLKRDTETYFKRFDNLAKNINNKIIVFSSPDNEERFSKYDNVVFYDGTDIFESAKTKYGHRINEIQKSKDFISFVDTPSLPEYWNPDYVLINYLKSTFAIAAYQKNFKDHANDVITWIDFGYARDNVFVPQNKHWVFDYSNKNNVYLWTNAVSVDTIKTSPIYRLIRNGTPLIRGCHIVSNYTGWLKLRDEMDNAINTLLDVDLIDDDQTMLLMAARKMNYRVTYNIGDSNNWFEIFEKYNWSL